MRTFFTSRILSVVITYMLLIALPTFASTQNVSKKYPVETLASRIQQLSKDYDVNIGYRAEQCNFEVSAMQLVNARIEEALDKSLRGTSFGYKKGSNGYIIAKNETAIGQQPKVANGHLKGRIVEMGSSEPLPGATIRITGTDKGAMSDLDGYYKINNLPAGQYTAEVTYIGYETQQTTIHIQPNRTATYDIVLTMDSKQLTEVVVTGIRRERGSVPHTTLSQISQEIKGLSVVASGISSEQISKSADRNAAQAAARVSGVSIVDNKFVVVRGLNQRYNLTYLNDNVAPATEVYDRSFALDLIPSRVIDKIIVLKSSAPEYQADATGGIVKVYTKEAQLVKHFDIDVQLGYRSGSTFKDMLTHRGGKWDMLGFDDGTRGLPAAVPAYGSTARANLTQREYVEAFSPVLWHNKAAAKPNMQVTANYYDVFKLGGYYLSSLTSFSYKHDEEVRDIYQQQGYSVYSEETGMYSMDESNDKISLTLQGTQTSQLNLLQNFTFNLDENNRFSFKNFLLQSGTSSNSRRTNTATHEYLNKEHGKLYVASFYNELNDILNYRQRFLYAGNLGGDHAFGEEKHKLKYNFGYSYTNQETPDQRTVRYDSPYYNHFYYKENDNLLEDLMWTATVRHPQPWDYETDVKSVLFGSISRIWMQNTDDLYNFSADYKFKPLKQLGFAIGTFQQFKRRRFYRRIFTVNEGDLTGTQDDYRQPVGYKSWVDPEVVRFSRTDIHNVWSGDYLRDDESGLKVYDRTGGADAYVGTEQNNAGYLSFQFTPWDGMLEVHGGVRAEYNRQRIGAAVPPNIWSDPTGINTPIMVDYGKLDWFPSINVSVKPVEAFVFRGGYAKTINRPEFRETSPFEEINYESGVMIFGNPRLRPSLAHNYDVRLEFYPRVKEKTGENISLGAFYKILDSPIERMNTSSRQESSYISNRLSYDNADKATIAGLELEMNKRLDFIPVGFFNKLSVSGNVSLIKSRVTKDSIRIEGGAYVNVDRRLQGQAPYLANVGLYYDNPGSGTKAGLVYNVVGERIYAAAIGFAKVSHQTKSIKGARYRGSLIELPRHTLDLSITQRIGKGLQAKLAVQNLLNLPVEMAEDFNFTYKYEPFRNLKSTDYDMTGEPSERFRQEGDNIASRYNPGVYVSASVSYSF